MAFSLEGSCTLVRRGRLLGPGDSDGWRKNIQIVDLGSADLHVDAIYQGGGKGNAGDDPLISRLRHRQFGKLITTSYVDLQAYREIKEDQHPIIVISAADIIELLKSAGHLGVSAVQAWLEREFSPDGRPS